MQIKLGKEDAVGALWKESGLLQYTIGDREVTKSGYSFELTIEETEEDDQEEKGNEEQGNKWRFSLVCWKARSSATVEFNLRGTNLDAVDLAEDLLLLLSRCDLTFVYNVLGVICALSDRNSLLKLATEYVKDVGKLSMVST